MKYYLLLSCLILSFASTAQLTVDGYTNHDLHGFNVLVEDAASTTNASLTTDAVNLLGEKLLEITQFCIDENIINSLKEVPIFVDWNTTTGAAQYHPSEAWLIQNGYLAEKAMCVEISNITNFVNWTNQNQPYMVLHELAHAYHHRVLNFNNSTITQAFDHAVALGLYTDVQYHAGNGVYWTEAAAYALNNEKEFFAEITEAYFGLNDYYPFTYNDLNTYDELSFNAMVTIWGVNYVDNSVVQSNNTLTANEVGATYQWLDCNNSFAPIANATNPSFTPTVNGNYAVDVSKNNCTERSTCFPITSITVGASAISLEDIRLLSNPSTGAFAVDLGTNYAKTTSIEIFGINGQLITTQQGGFDRQQVHFNIKNSPSGIYLIKVLQNEKHQVLKLIKNNF